MNEKYGEKNIESFQNRLDRIYFSNDQPVKSVDESQKTEEEKPKDKPSVSKEEIMRIIKDLDTDLLREKLNSKIFGQEQAIESLVEGIEEMKLFGAEKGKPINVMLFDGPTGVGKTEFAKVISEAIFDRPPIHVPLGGCSGSSLKNYLSGSTYGFVGSGEKVNFVEEIKNNPFSVLLLDEIEKPLSDEGGMSAQGIFLDMFDEGRFTTQKGETIDLSGMIVIATTNAQASKDEVFTPEFKARFRSKVDFNPINKETAIKIALKTIESKIKRFEEQQSVNKTKNTLVVEESVAEYIASQSDYEKEGARAIINNAGRTLSTLLRNKLKESNPTNSQLKIEIKNEKPLVRILPAQKSDDLVM